MEPILSLNNVSKMIGKKKIIDQLSLSVQPGEVFGLLGPNGAGKTTTIRMIVGLMRLSEGDIFIGGTSIKSNFEQAIKQVGAIVENPEMYKHLTGYQNLIQYSRMHKGIDRDKINEVVDLVKLTDNIHRKVKTYSLGMRQRLGLAQCLLHDPKLLILDEPTNGLDPAGIREIREHLRYLTKERQMSVIVSSHLLSEMEMMCDRIAIIQQGKLIDIQSVKGEQEEQTNNYYIETSDLGAVYEILTKEWKIDRKAEGFTIEATKEDIAKLLKQLIEASIDVYLVNKISKTLEDRFLEITGS
ncbi:ABC-2 type transport system ATP-binding protein [Amphibacillus marinus]|uniref:ABC-2 type transport system ATP-binding protein n=1 Tax=Amphibacillus marinus TaxID=872970 RepID=A0A1H8K597_9BACI|nr:ABC transporter ATP-binding protein [Amphibacillus marinus]SEN88152.1 ABC-2 type transport system ATP-binding protein [Amphibacillus marinus]